MPSVGRTGICDRCRGRIESDQEYEWYQGSRMVHAGECFDAAPGVREKTQVGQAAVEKIAEKIEERKAEDAPKEPDEKPEKKEAPEKPAEAPAPAKQPESKSPKEKDKGITKSVN